MESVDKLRESTRLNFKYLHFADVDLGLSYTKYILSNMHSVYLHVDTRNL